MEPPTCVVDASTLVEHIQEIKRWTQQGRLCLVVPLCTLDNVKQICDKEIKTRGQQLHALQLQKSTGKPARREQPTYDNNPRVTLEFLNRLRAENGDGMVFQCQGEEYSPWQRAQTPPPRQVQDERPATFAEAVRHKLNATNGTSGAPGATKGPAKAKLVARASATDMSPWKINKSAPRASANSVPVALRPLLSYTLWRLYEERNTLGVGKPCILLTNDVTTYNVAQTLTICVGTISQIRQLIASQTKTEDLESYGELEREFGRREPLPKRDPDWRKLRAKAREANKDDVPDGSTDKQDGDVDKPESQVVHPINDGDLTIKDTEAGVPEIRSNTTNMEEPPIVSEDQKSVQESLTKANSAVNLLNIEDTEQAGLINITREKPVDTLCHVELASTATEKETNERSANTSTSNLQPADRQDDDWQAKKDVIHMPIIAGSNEKPTPMIVDNGVLSSTHDSLERKTVSPQAKTQNQQCSSPSAASSGSMPCSPRPSSETNSLSTTEAQEPEDSDEEVVVFNPRAKRWSSQSKSVKDIPQPKSPAKPLNSRNVASGLESPPHDVPCDRVPITPAPSLHAQPSLLPPNQSSRDQTPSEQSPRGQVHRDQAHSEQNLGRRSPQNLSPTNISPRKVSPRNHSPRNQVQRKQHRPNQAPPSRAPPAIIDPDFFGRSPVVNIKANGQNGQNGQGRYFHRGGPRRGPRGHEADVEYVLTSGTTREATRGKGKLWVP